MAGRPRQDVQRFQKQKKRTHYFKFILLGVACALIFLVLMWPKINQVILLFTAHRMGNLRIDVSKIDLQNKFVENPKFVGGGETPYTLLADQAKQVSERQIILTQVKGRITLKDGSVLSVLADEGHLDIGAVPKGIFKGDVTFIYNKGDTEIWTDHVHVDMKKGTLTTTDPVHGAGAFGDMKGPSGLFIDQKNNLIRLHGPAEVVIKTGASQ